LQLCDAARAEPGQLGHCDNRDAGLFTKLYFRTTGQGQKACVNLLAKTGGAEANGRLFSFANKTDADCSLCEQRLCNSVVVSVFSHRSRAPQGAVTC